MAGYYVAVKAMSSVIVVTTVVELDLQACARDVVVSSHINHLLSLNVHLSKTIFRIRLLDYILYLFICQLSFIVMILLLGVLVWWMYNKIPLVRGGDWLRQICVI